MTVSYFPPQEAFTFYRDKGIPPKNSTNFASGNETQPVADARGNHVYGK